MMIKARYRFNSLVFQYYIAQSLEDSLVRDVVLKTRE